MNFLPEYILKLSISLAGVFLFYYFILRRLTFYNYNRWYLLGYTALSFLIPFINVSAVLQQNKWEENGIVDWVPVLKTTAVTELPATASAAWSIWQWAIAIVVMGVLVMLCRLAIQLFSFKKMLQQAQPVSNDGMKLYQVNDNIIPFSFGNAIFINRHLHPEHELEEIIRHEFVHVKQRHSIDIIWVELLCIINWYNPFVWLLKRSIRQNLEFIADHKVLENGIDKTAYQYLLLKVIGNNQYSIANQFNFSSLKKRIAMMNKTKSAKRQLIRLLFLLPATAVLLLAFRSKWSAAGNAAVSNDKNVAIAGLVVDAKALQSREKVLKQLPAIFNPGSPAYDGTISRDTTKKNKPNSKGYIISIKNINGDDMVIVKNKAGKEIKNMPLTEWNENAEKNRSIYGDPVSEPPVPPAVAAIPATALPVLSPAVIEVAAPVLVNVGVATSSTVKVAAVVSSPVKVATATKVSLVEVPANVVVEVPVNAIMEVPVTAAVIATPATAAVVAKLPDNVKKVQINNNKVTLWLKNGKKENFDLNNAEEKKELEKKYGIYAPGTPVVPVEMSPGQPATGVIKN